MHKRSVKDGLAVISVSLDEAAEKKNALGWLTKFGADFTNVLLDEETDFFQKRLRFVAPPCLYVFNRQGKWTQFKSDEKEIDFKKVDQLVEKLLKEK